MRRRARGPAARRAARLAAALIVGGGAAAGAQQVGFEAFTGGPALVAEEIGAVGPWRIVVYRAASDAPAAACSAASVVDEDPSGGAIGPPTLLLTVWTAAPETVEIMVAYERAQAPDAPGDLALETDGRAWPFFNDGRRDAWWPATDAVEPFLAAFERAGAVKLLATDAAGAPYPPALAAVGDARAALAMAAAACKLEAGRTD